MEKKRNNTELDLDEDGIPKLEYIQVGERVPTETQTSCLFFDAFDG